MWKEEEGGDVQFSNFLFSFFFFLGGDVGIIVNYSITGLPVGTLPWHVHDLGDAIDARLTASGAETASVA